MTTKDLVKAMTEQRRISGNLNKKKDAYDSNVETESGGGATDKFPGMRHECRMWGYKVKTDLELENNMYVTWKSY